MRAKSDSLSSSESSYNHNSPEYPPLASVQRVRNRTGDSQGEEWCQNQTINTTQLSHDTTSDDDSSQEDVDDEDNISVQEVNVDDVDVEVDDDVIDVQNDELNLQHMQISNVEDTLVEGHDYDVITVYTVNPDDIDLMEASSDDEKEQIDFAINDNEESECDEPGEYLNPESNTNVVNYEPQPASNIRQQVMDILSRPVESSADEYLLKTEILDEPVVKDVDEYFIKDKDKETISVPNVDDFFIKNKLPEEETAQFSMPEPLPNVDEFLVKSAAKVETQEECVEPDSNVDAHDMSINESDLEVLPKLEDLKRFLLEDLSESKLKNIQRSCSVPQSPMQSILDIEDAKTCLSFEDLNLDLSDLAFDNDKDKSDGANKSDDIPRTLTEEDVNSFLITCKIEKKEPQCNEDDFSHQDMEIERPLETSIIHAPLDRKMTSTPIPSIPTPAVIEYCPENSPVKKEKEETKTELDDFVDVEMCNDGVIPVLEANNLSSLLEQFEATEKLNIKRPQAKMEEKVKNKNSLTNGMRLQDAGVQLNKNKMRQILMPSTINTTLRSPSPVHSDHDYCSSKKRHSLPNLKGGQSLLKPEVLSSNNRILSSRHRSCKNKKVVYHLSSDDESDKGDAKNKKVNKSDDADFTTKVIKQPVKPPAQSNCRKKLSPPHNSLVDCVNKDNGSVIIKSACKAGDLPCSQNSNGSIKLTIKNKSEVILNCDVRDSQKDKQVEKCTKSSVSDNSTNCVKVKHEKSKDVDRNKHKHVNNVENNNVKEESARPKEEHFYTALFSNKQDVQIPHTMQVKSEKRPFDEELNKIAEEAIKKEMEQPLKKKKLNLQEYKLRRGVNSNNSSATVSPEAIFPDIPSPSNLDKTKSIVTLTPPNGANSTEKAINEAPKKIFDPIREASRKILMNTKKQKAEAMRKRDEDIVMSKIPKVENLELQPLISDAEMLKIVGMAPAEVLPIPVVEKPQPMTDYIEIIMVSVGTNTDEKIFKKLQAEAKLIELQKSPPTDTKSLINFKIKKSDHVLKQNVFDNVKRDKRSPVDDKKPEPKIDKERFRDITATLKSVEKQVETKILSNSLFASIQDVVMKKAPDEVIEKPEETKYPKLKSLQKKDSKPRTVTIVRDYDAKADHGEDKVILHLGKDRSKPESSSIVVQTESTVKYVDLPTPIVKDKPVRQRNDSDMSLSSESSPTRKHNKTEDKVAPKPRVERVEKRSLSKEKRSRSKERYEPKYRRRSRSLSRSRRRRRSVSRSRSKSRGRYRRYRRSDSPYKRRRRSRSPYHKRRSPSVRRERNRTRSRSRADARSKSPVVKKVKQSPQSNGVERKINKSMTPPLRKPTVSESSDSSTSSSSSSSSSSTSSSSSRESLKSRRSCSPFDRDEPYRKKAYRSVSSEDRENNTPVEERRIVFVGRLEKDITKSTLRSQFSKFGSVVEVRLHSKEDGSRYGFVTYQRARDAWSAVEAAATFPQYDVGFGGRRAFCRQSYADLDGLEAKYTESAFHGQSAAPARRPDDMSFEQMLLDMKKKLSQRKNDKQRADDKP
ncbi:hypothetical protein O3G_MSEX009363 [Manduca sexta]|nr:hypothetical protein O3G_MSEX009363 [Manduca sexta]